MDRMIFDSLREMSDPQANSSFRRIMSKARTETNQEFWWKPGEPLLVERAPDVGAVVGEWDALRCEPRFLCSAIRLEPGLAAPSHSRGLDHEFVHSAKPSYPAAVQPFQS